MQDKVIDHMMIQQPLKKMPNLLNKIGISETHCSSKVSADNVFNIYRSDCLFLQHAEYLMPNTIYSHRYIGFVNVSIKLDCSKYCYISLTIQLNISNLFTLSLNVK